MCQTRRSGFMINHIVSSLQQIPKVALCGFVLPVHVLQHAADDFKPNLFQARL